jgi:hypothetical protein
MCTVTAVSLCCVAAQAAARDEARKRGKTEFYTSDPKFDERFQLGYQMTGQQVRWVFVFRLHLFGCTGWMQGS